MSLKTLTAGWPHWPLSLLESVLAVVLLAVVASGAAVAHKRNPDDAIRKTARAVDEMQGINIYLQNRQQQLRIPPPTEAEGLASLIGADGVNGVLTEVPRDPWGQPYQYRNDGHGFVLFSFGPDGVQSKDDVVLGPR